MSEFYEGLADIFEVDASEITPEFVLDSEIWDSLAVVSTIALIDEVFDKTVSGEALSNCKTVGDLDRVAQAA